MTTSVEANISSSHRDRRVVFALSYCAKPRTSCVCPIVFVGSQRCFLCQSSFLVRVGDADCVVTISTVILTSQLLLQLCVNYT